MFKSKYTATNTSFHQYSGFNVFMCNSKTILAIEARFIRLYKVVKPPRGSKTL